MPEPVRIQKFIADAGVCSRREAEVLIRQGFVSVNQQTAVLGQKVTPGVDRVVVESKVIKSVFQEEVTLLFNKPGGVSCQRNPPEKLASVYDYVPKEHRDRKLLVAGELETESVGLVILTTDGELHNHLVHGSGGVIKRYRASLEEPVSATKIERLRKGFVFQGERLRVEEVTILSRRNDGLVSEVELATTHGRKLEIRRLFDFLRADLRRLRRVQIGGFVLKRIPLGLCRPLSQVELKLLSESGAREPGRGPRPTRPVRSGPPGGTRRPSSSASPSSSGRKSFKQNRRRP